VRARIPVLLLALLLIPATLQASEAASNFPTVPSIGFSSSDDNLIETNSFVTGYSYPEGATSGLYSRTISCTSVDDPACAESNSIFAQVILPPCSTTATEMCVDSLELSNSKGSMQRAALSYEIAGTKFPASTLRGVPIGGTASVWKSNEIMNASNSEEYAVSVNSTFQNFQNKGCTQYTTTPCAFTVGFRARVIPIKRVQKEGIAQKCLWVESQICVQGTDFSAGTRAALSLKMNNALTGFLFGRMKNVDLDLKPLSASTNLLRVEADPIDVPKIYAYVAKSELTKYPKIVEYWKIRRQQLASTDFTSSQTIDTGPSPEWALNDFLAFEALVKSGDLVTSIWRFGTQAGFGTGSKCFDDKTKLQGLVTTNAPTYVPNPPLFDKGELVYKVAGAHHLADGTTVFKGTYDLALRSDFARCLYGFSKAPVQAKISIIATDGSTQDVATESVHEDSARQWLYLIARNFTFSSPTIKVKLSQPATSTTPISNSAKQLAIKCVKGKVMKTIKGINPKCPLGYKRK
jgi:hypothetical protein